MTAEGQIPEPRKPQLVIEFGGVGSAEMTFRPDPDVTVAQLYAAAWLLDAWARETRAGQAVLAAQGKIQLLPPGLAAQLGLRGRD